jgi:biopolymer transport protein ExbD
MRFKRQIKLEYKSELFDVIPFLNIFFLLLLLFISTSFFTVSPRILVKLPKTITSDVVKNENVFITVTSENIIYMNNKVVTFKELTDQLTRMNPKNKQLLIKADRRASVGRLIDLWDLCRRLGIEKVNIGTSEE